MKLECLISGITDTEELEKDLFGLKKLEVGSYSCILDINSRGDRVFLKAAREHGKCDGPEIPNWIMLGKPEVRYIPKKVFLTIDAFGNRLQLWEMDLVMPMPLSMMVQEHTSGRLEECVIRIARARLEDVLNDLDYLARAKAVIIMLVCRRSAERNELLEKLKDSFDEVEDLSDREILYVRCYNGVKPPVESNQECNGSEKRDDDGVDNNVTSGE